MTIGLRLSGIVQSDTFSVTFALEHVVLKLELDTSAKRNLTEKLGTTKLLVKERGRQLKAETLANLGSEQLPERLGSQLGPLSLSVVRKRR